VSVGSVLDEGYKTWRIRCWIFECELCISWGYVNVSCIIVGGGGNVVKYKITPTTLLICKHLISGDIRHNT